LKRFPVHILTISLFVVACHNDDINSKEKRNNHWDWWVDASTGKGKWIPLSDHPTWKNGTYTSFYYDGKVFEKGKIKDGKNLDTTYWFDREGKNYGYKLHRADSAIDYFINDGPVKVFGDDGKIRMEGTVKNHTQGDRWIEYYENGFVKRDISCKNDTGWMVNYYQSEQIEDSDFVMGNTGAVIKHWYKNGQLAHSVGWRNNQYDGEIEDFYENGQLKQKGNYVNGQFEGEGKYWYPSGKLKGIANYQMGVQTGKQIMYFENGQIQAELCTKDGKMDGEQKQYDSNGKIVKDAFFKDGVKIK
jgi:antitoxin component YwqK of YwqJK toxin-antitoxin module